MKKKIDPRIDLLVRNSTKVGHRAVFVIVGDRGRYQVHSFYRLPILDISIPPSPSKLNPKYYGATKNSWALAQINSKGKNKLKISLKKDYLNKASTTHFNYY